MQLRNLQICCSDCETCSDCEALFEFVKDEDPASATQLLEECRECCFIDRDPNIKYVALTTLKAVVLLASHISRS